MKNKEKIIRDLVNTYNDRDELHMAYKQKMKDIFAIFIDEIIEEELFEVTTRWCSLVKFIDNFVETHFKPKD